jgi:hypothetical protein
MKVTEYDNGRVMDPIGVKRQSTSKVGKLPHNVLLSVFMLPQPEMRAHAAH